MHTVSERYRVPKAAALRLFLPSEMRLGKVREAFKNFEKSRSEQLILGVLDFAFGYFLAGYRNFF